MSARARLSHPIAAFTVLALTSVAATATAAPYFQDVVSPYGVQGCSGGKVGCWTNYMRMTDIDGDGDLDVLFPNSDGYFSKGAAEPFGVYLNDGTGVFTDGSQKIVNGYSGFVRQIATGDVDGDGDLDLYIPSAWGDADVLLFNDAGVFVDHAATNLPGLHSNAGATRFADVDNDGDLDLFVSDGWAQSAPTPAHLYLNDGTGKFTEAPAGTLPSGKGAQPIDFDVFDADGDHDLDLLIDLHATKQMLWINDGAGHFTDASASLPAQSGLKYGPVPCDVDGDGDLDIWVDNSGPSYTEQLLINDGTGKFADETAMRVSGNVNGADDNGVACVDIDGDGDLDAVIASLSNNERVLLNDGTGHFTALAGAFPQVSDSTLWFDFGDVNGDGRIDCATAQGESSFLNRLYLGTPNAPVDVLAPTFRQVEDVKGPVSASATPMVRFGVVDNATTDEGPRLRKAWVRVTVGGAMTDVPATFSGGDLYRAVLPAQSGGVTVSYEACAKDWQGNQGCAPAKTYLVDGGASTSSASASSGASGSGTSGAGGAGGAGAGGSVSASTGM
ncbi:MAG: VCBS repeat-containing protein, partial [Byssovorax sp.]